MFHNTANLYVLLLSHFKAHPKIKEWLQHEMTFDKKLILTRIPNTDLESWTS